MAKKKSDIPDSILTPYIRASYPLIYICTPEENRAELECLRAAAHCKREFATWSVTTGLLDAKDKKAKEIKFLLYLFVGLVLVETFYVAYAHFVLHQWARAAGSLGHPNGLAMYAGMFVPLLLVMAMTYRGKGLVTLTMVLALLGSFTMVIKSGARAGIGAMCVTSAIAVFLVLRKDRIGTAKR